MAPVFTQWVYIMTVEHEQAKPLLVSVKDARRMLGGGDESQHAPEAPPD
jgi:Iap family predicted aminopeptidase